MEETKAKSEEAAIPAANDYKRHLGENVRRLREMLGISQKQLALELGYTASNLCRLEGKENLDPEALKKIADALKVPVELIENFRSEEIVNKIQSFYDEARQNIFEDESRNVENDNSTTENSHNTNTFDVIQFALEANQKLSDRIITDKDATIKELKAKIAALESENKELLTKSPV